MDETPNRTFLLAGAVAGLIAVAFGAFGAHGLQIGRAHV